MTLAVDWHGSNLAGWFVSEKLNGCRAFWDGWRFWTRGGNVIPAPKWFTRGLPRVPLDGEIWAGRGVRHGNDNSAFKIASKAVRLGGHWFEDGHLEFVAFDFPEACGSWDKRIRQAARALKQSAIGRAIDFFQINPRCRDYGQLTAFLRKIRLLGGEGACMRNPDVIAYEIGRSANLLRFKFC